MLINQTLNLGKKMLKKMNDIFEKIQNFLCDKLVRKKTEINLVEIYKPLYQVEAH